MDKTGKKSRWALKALLALVWLAVAGVVCYAALIGLVSVSYTHLRAHET